MIPSSIPQWLKSAFIKAAQATGAEADEETLLGAYHWLIERWGAVDRQCHGIKHVADVLSNVDVLADSTQHANCVRLAAWYHGVVFDWADDAAYSASAGAGEDEDASAELASEQLAAIGIPQAAIERITALIRSMRSRSEASEVPDAPALRDAHLGTLAVDPQRYKKYRESVRAEFSHISDVDFARARLQVIGRLLDRRHIFQSPLAAQWEDSARENLKAEARLLNKILAEQTAGEAAEDGGADPHEAVSDQSLAPTYSAHYPDPNDSYDDVDPNMVIGAHEADGEHPHDCDDHIVHDEPSADTARALTDAELAATGEDNEIIEVAREESSLAADPISPHREGRGHRREKAEAAGGDQSGISGDGGAGGNVGEGGEAQVRHDSAEVSSLERSAEEEQARQSQVRAAAGKVFDPPHSDAHAIASATHHSEDSSHIDPTAVHPPTQTPRRTSIRELATGAAPSEHLTPAAPATGAPANERGADQPSAPTPQMPTRASESERGSGAAEREIPNRESISTRALSAPSPAAIRSAASADTASRANGRPRDDERENMATVTSTLEVCAEDFTAPRPVPEATSEADRARREREAKRAERERIAAEAREKIEARTEKAARERADRLTEEDSVPELSEPSADGDATAVAEGEVSTDDSQYYGMERGPGVLSERKGRDSKRDKD